MKDLISLRKKWKELKSKYNGAELAYRYDDYMEFTGRILELGMFVPCNGKGEPLEEPTDMYTNEQYYGAAMDEYQKAKEKVLFEGFQVRVKGEFGVAIVNKEGVRLDWRFHKNRFFQGYYTIEDLTGLGLKYKGKW